MTAANNPAGADRSGGESPPQATSGPPGPEGASPTLRLCVRSKAVSVPPGTVTRASCLRVRCPGQPQLLLICVAKLHPVETVLDLGSGPGS